MKALWTLLVLFCAAGLAAAADLSKIERKVVKEPAYQTKPQYALLVFGPDAATRVWLVADGDKVYLDRNGNGDLTEASEGIDLKNPNPKKAGEPASPANAGVSEVTADGKKYRVLGIQNIGVQMKEAYAQQKEALKGQKDADQQLKQIEEQVKAMDGNFMVTIETPAKMQQFATMVLKPNAQDAPVLHFGGPLKFWTNAQQQLTRGGDVAELSTVLVTPGYAKNTGSFGEVMVMVNCCTEESVPKNLHPTVEIEFPNKEAGGKPIIAKYEIKERCWGAQFHGPVRVPEQAATGTAKATFSFPAWKEGNVAATSFEIKIVDGAK